MCAFSIIYNCKIFVIHIKIHYILFFILILDYDPKVVEQKEQAQPACLPLSYVLRFISDDARKESPFLTANAAGVELKRKLAIKHHSYSMSSSNRSNTPTGKLFLKMACANSLDEIKE